MTSVLSLYSERYQLRDPSISAIMAHWHCLGVSAQYTFLCCVVITARNHVIFDSIVFWVLVSDFRNSCIISASPDASWYLSKIPALVQNADTCRPLLRARPIGLSFAPTTQTPPTHG